MALFRRSRSRQKTYAKEVRQHLWWQFFFGLIAISLVLLVSLLVWYLTRMPGVTITTVTVEGGETIDREMIRADVEAELLGSYFLLIPKRFTYTYPHDRIIEVLNTVPRIHSITVEREDRNALHVQFMEYVPNALWCDSEESYALCTFLDQKGFSFAPAPPLRGGTFVRYLTEGRAPEVSAQVAAADRLADIERFIDVLEIELALRANTVLFTEEGDAEIRIHGGGTLKIAFDVTMQETLDNLKSILESEEFSHLEPGNFNYIDLRFGDRVFVKEEFSEEVPNATSTEGTAQN